MWIYVIVISTAPFLFKANLRGATPESNQEDGFCTIKRVNLEGANMTKAQQRNLFVTDCIMRRVNLTGANLSNAVPGGTIMRNANVANANFKGVELATVSMAFSSFSKALNANIPDYIRDLR